MREFCRTVLTAILLGLILPAGNSNAAHFAVASAHPLATEAGISALRSGGNAFDAAVAVASVLAVVEPYSSGLGGGGLFLLHQQDKDRQVMLDARERAPLRASSKMYLDANGNVNRDLLTNGPLSAGIPGIPAALEFLQNNYGKRSLSRNLSYAIEVARNGFEVDEIYQQMAKSRLKALQRYPSTQEIFLDNGKAPAVGTLLKQSDLANTLEKIAIKGKSAFYRGKIAAQMVDGARANGGIWSLQDLNQYQVIERDPIEFFYKDAQIVTASLPSSGGIVLENIFNQLDILNFDVADPIDQTHMLVEAMRRSYRDRAEFLGDPDYVDIPVEHLTSMQHARQHLSDYSAQRASISTRIDKVQDIEEGEDTTHFSIIDAEGNIVSATLSINYPFGSGFVAAGTGVLLNNEMDDFSASPDVPNGYGLVGNEANAIQPGKRMLSSMTPAIVFGPNRTLISGTPGGSRIITMQLLGILEFLNNKNAVEIVSYPRFHHQYLPDVISFEKDAFSWRTQTALQLRGHELKELSFRYGNMHVIIVDHQRAEIHAASDPRGIGRAVATRDKRHKKQLEP